MQYIFQNSTWFRPKVSTFVELLFIYPLLDYKTLFLHQFPQNWEFTIKTNVKA